VSSHGLTLDETDLAARSRGAEFSEQGQGTTLAGEHSSPCMEFSHAPADALRFEPHLLRVLDVAANPPESTDSCRTYVIQGIPRSEFEKARLGESQTPAHDVLHWANFWFPASFSRLLNAFVVNQRADQMLLNNLRHLRKCCGRGLANDDVCHDFLPGHFCAVSFDAKDSSGNSALNATNSPTFIKQTFSQWEHQNFAQPSRQLRDGISCLIG